MNCDPNTLMANARCLKCIPAGTQKEVQIYLICQWLNNNESIPLDEIFWTPPSITADWSDSGGVHTGDLPTFLANADIPTVDSLVFNTKNVVTIGNVNYLPALATLICSDCPLLTSVDLHGVVSLSGNLAIINCGPLPTLTANDLQSVGFLDIDGNASLQSINTPSMTTADQVLIQLNPSLLTVDISALQSVTGGDFNCNTNASLTQIVGTSLASIVGSLYVYDNISITSCWFGNLTGTVANITIAGNSNMVDLNLSSVQHITGDFECTDNTSLTTLQMDELLTCGTAFSSNQWIITNCPLLGISAPKMTFCSFINSPNIPSLQSLNFPLLVISEGMDFSTCDILSASFPKLTNVNQGGLSGNLFLFNNFNMTLADFPELIVVDVDLDISGDSLVVFSFPKLFQVGGNLLIYGNSVMPSMSLPALGSVSGSIDLDSSLLLSLSIPVLDYCASNIDMSFCASLDNPTFGSGAIASSINGVVTFGCTSMTTLGSPTEVFSWGCGQCNISSLSISASYTNGTNFVFEDNNLSQASVDGILCGISGATVVTGGNITLNNPGIGGASTNSAPSAAGLACKATLEALVPPWTVTVAP